MYDIDYCMNVCSRYSFYAQLIIILYTIYIYIEREKFSFEVMKMKGINVKNYG